MTSRLLAGLLVLTAVVSPQHRVDPKNTYHRVICVVPIVGAGTLADPRRPMYAPLPPSQPPQVKPAAPPRDAILAYSHQVSDDGKYALVEFVAADRAAFLPILNDKQITVLFEKGKSSKQDIEKELKKYKKDFDLDNFGLVLP